ncbi:hypothetical protein [Pseudooctadecabacter sp.]|uniref:hypothetical protein n=1 Tax=Pseudooctadecabacter sp. TaxID=1966338 RepID=UPI0025EDB334|nr:hypothetical protein [Pseudooctadecabacter sp.]
MSHAFVGMTYEIDMMRWHCDAGLRLEQQRREAEALILDCEIMRINAFRMQAASRKMKDGTRLAQSLIESSRSILR